MIGKTGDVMEKLILYYQNKRYFIDEYDTEQMWGYEKGNLIRHWRRMIGRELNITRRKLNIHFLTQMELCGSRLKPYIVIKYPGNNKPRA